MIKEEDVLDLANYYYAEYKIKSSGRDHLYVSPEEVKFYKIESNQVLALCKALVEIFNKEFSKHN